MSTVQRPFSPEKYIDNLASLPLALKSYIPKQLLRHVDMKKIFMQNEHQYIQSVLDHSNNELRMYGPAKSLLTNLQNYMDFPLSRKLFPLGIGNYCYTIPKLYQTLKGEILYCKQDHLFYLQSCVYSELKLRDRGQSSKYVELIEYMKKHEERLGGCYEFVTYDHEAFEDVRKSFRDAATLYVFPENAKTTVRFLPPRIIEYKDKDFVKVFDDLTSKYPWLFLPNSETNDKNATAVVRLFDDSNLKFVMESELFAAINLKNPDREQLECLDADGEYRIIDYKLVIELFREQISDINFLYHPIGMCQHRTVPIVAPTGDHCIQAVDAFLDIIMETVLVLGIFQKLTRNTLHMIPKFVAILEKYFPSNIKYRYFINLKVFQKIQKELEEFWKPIEDRPVKKVRNVGPNGFTVEDLKKELKYLGYTETFNEIAAEARTAYTFLFQGRKPNELKTTDMFRAIEACLTRSMFKRFPCFQEFMYRQKVCPHHRAKPCEFCLKAFKDVEARIEAEKKEEHASMLAAVTATISTNETIKDRNPINQEALESSEESKPESVITEAINATDPNVELNNVNPVKSPESNTVLPDSSSLICEKCMETSNEAREEVVETYKKMIILEKTLKEKDAELERLRIFEQKSKKSDETEKKVKDLEKEAEEWKKKHLKILEENVKMGNMLKNAGRLKELESQLKKKDEQLSTIRSELKENAQKYEKLEKTIEEKDEEIHELSEAEKSEKQEKEGFKASMNSLLHQLKDKDEEINELKKANEKSGASRDEEIKKLQNCVSEFRKIASQGVEQLKEKNSIIEELELKNSKITEKKNEEIEKLKKEQEYLTKENKKEMEQLKEEKNSVIQELEMKNSRIIEEKNKEIEKLKQQQASIAKENQKEIEQLKRNASKSADEIKKLTMKITEGEALGNRLKRSNNEFLEKLQKSDSSLQEITKKQNQLVTEITGKNRIIQELQKSAEKQVSERENAEKELETRISTIREVLDLISPPEPTEKPECLICFYEMRPDEKTLKCEHCRKVVHFECASKWLKIHRSCAHCRREQLDPNEFPSLQ